MPQAPARQAAIASDGSIELAGVTATMPKFCMIVPIGWGKAHPCQAATANSIERGEAVPPLSPRGAERKTVGIVTQRER
jgi:hypothetical protein